MQASVRLTEGKTQRINGWENIHNWLSIAPDGWPYLRITENCQNLIRTLPELVHDEINVEDVDEQGEDHAPDALRYMLKAVKWIDAKVEGVGTPGIADKKINPSAPMKIDADAWVVNSGDVAEV